MIYKTAGVYFPVALAKLIKYFGGKTIITKEHTVSFAFEFNVNFKDIFMFFWKQFFLTIFTLTIYAPWAYSKSIKYFFEKIEIIKID